MCCRVKNFINLSTLIPSLCWSPLLNIAYVYCLIILLNSQKVVYFTFCKFSKSQFKVHGKSLKRATPSSITSLSVSRHTYTHSHVDTHTVDEIELCCEKRTLNDMKDAKVRKTNSNKTNTKKKRTLFSIPPKKRPPHLLMYSRRRQTTTHDDKKERSKTINVQRKKGREERWVKNKAYITTTPVKYYHKFCWQNAKNVDDDDDDVVVIIILIVVVVDVMAGASAGVVCVREWLCFSCCCFCLKKVNEPFRYDFTSEWLWKFFVSIIKFRYSLCCKLFWLQSYADFFQVASKVGDDFGTANSLIKVSHSLFFFNYFVTIPIFKYGSNWLVID